MTSRLALIGALSATLIGCAGTRPAEVRLDAIRKAQVWTKTNVSAMDIKTGPTGPGAFPVDATVTCEYVDKKMAGRSPKFTCKIPPDDEVKVKYGPANDEVYAEVAASRLLWALGFGADHMYPVRIVCKGCPQHIVGTEVAAIERKMPGTEIESDIETGWAWRELDLVDPDEGGATRAERDALKLLAVFLQHTDSKAGQQRLLCLGPESGNGKDTKRQEAEECDETFMLVQDVGLTFGRATSSNRSPAKSTHLREWAATPIWKDPGRCVANMKKSMTGTLKDPVISEEGRKFLASLLVQLTDQQLRDLFEVARFARRPAETDRPATTIDQWVQAFKQKRTEIVDHSCPN